MEASKEKQRGVVRFLRAEGVGGMDIHRRMSQVYGEHCMYLARVKAWHKRLREGRVSLADDARSGTPHRITDGIVQLVDGLVTQATELQYSESSSCRGWIKCRKRSHHHDGKTELALAQWVPRSLQPQQETGRMVHCIDHLQRYSRE